MSTPEPLGRRLGGGGIGMVRSGSLAVRLAIYGLMTWGGKTLGFGRAGVSMGVSICLPNLVVAM